jgi:UDP-N-acetyl-D-mannosaminuronic acid dehydrogenase
MTQTTKSPYQVCVLGGAGHVGLPLAITFANANLKTLVYDINQKSLETIGQGIMPFLEEGAEPLLKSVLAAKTLGLSSKISDLAGIPFIVLTIGTPVDEFLNPHTKLITQCMDELLPHLVDGQTLILRSTVSPGITDWVDRYVRSKNKKIHIAFCPERVVQGLAIKEIQTLPQIVSGMTPAAEDSAAELFLKIAPEVVRMKPMEAEFAKLFSNAYRYLQFATTNQFYMMASLAGLDYSAILKGMTQNYPRNQGIPKPGFAAGPCLFKDTMQLSAFYSNQFSLGSHAMNVNEGLPLFIIDQLKQKCDLKSKTIGLLGMAFKAESDDIRSSLSYKLKKALKTQAKKVLTTDHVVENDPELLPLEQVVDQSDILILCTPHSAYKTLNLKNKPVIDVWNFYGKGSLIPNVS